MALKWPDKDPQEILDYPLKFDDWLVAGADIQGAPLPTVVQDGVSVPNGLTDIVVDSVSVSGKSVITFLSAGTDGEVYTFKVIAKDTLTPARTVVRLVKIKVKVK